MHTHDFLIIYNEISFSVNFFSVTDIIYLMDRNFHRLLYYELLFIKHITFEMMDRIRMLMMMTNEIFVPILNKYRQTARVNIENPVARFIIYGLNEFQIFMPLSHTSRCNNNVTVIQR